jgi:predicted nuclease of predicted toxin-antitoxin system
MLILFDQSTPVSIRPFLQEHNVETAWRRKWDKLANGELLKAAEDAGFDVFVTPDKNIRYQQNLKGRKIAIVVLGTPQWPVLRLHVERVVEAINAAKPGSYIEIEVPPR